MAPGRFLLACIDGGGTVPPLLELAGRLARRNHDVLVLGDPTVASSASAARCSYVPWQRAPSFATVEQQTALIKNLQRRNPLAQFALARDRIICGPARRFADDVLKTVHEHPVDVMLVDAVLAGALIGAEATGCPTAALMPNVYVRPTPDRPEFGTGWCPARGVLGRGRDRLVATAVGRLWAGGLPAINSARTSLGLPPVGNLYDLLDICARVSAEALGRRHVRAVRTTGRAIDPVEIPAPDNVRVIRAAPHGQVLKEASLVITHAGHGSVLKALAAGVPMICMPQGRDQNDNTTRALRLGTGIRISKRSSEDQIAAAVSAVLVNPDYARAARRFAATLAEEGERHPDATREAEDLLGQARR